MLLEWQLNCRYEPALLAQQRNQLFFVTQAADFLIILTGKPTCCGLTQARRLLLSCKHAAAAAAPPLQAITALQAPSSCVGHGSVLYSPYAKKCRSSRTRQLRCSDTRENTLQHSCMKVTGWEWTQTARAACRYALKRTFPGFLLIRTVQDERGAACRSAVRRTQPGYTPIQVLLHL